MLKKLLSKIFKPQIPERKPKGGFTPRSKPMSREELKALAEESQRRMQERRTAASDSGEG